MNTGKKRSKPKKIREQEFVDSFDGDFIDEHDDIFDMHEESFHEMYHRMERDRSLGRDERYD
ncbi:hypothetical protein LJC19_03470 [Oxalobacter sp. OttesenSCG-928-P03]|nr:hypothetical protein [Oxalobacter sp. OttesenSCG-928-P03]